jgi:hypothetical protein
MINKNIEIFFLEHPSSVCMSYYEHFLFSGKLGCMFVVAGYKAFIHAICPALYVTSSSDFSEELYIMLSSAGCKD